MGNNQGQPKDLISMQKYSGMTVKHVTLLRERLELLSDADLSINKESFALAMKTKEQETDRIFKIFDLSSSGKIETLEFICALSILSHANLQDKCDLIFGLYDFDKNRTMNKQELIILIKTVLTTINAISAKGECTIQEALGYANVILERYDTNGDASISMKEFYSFVSKDPDILNILLSYGLISLQDLRFNFGEPPKGFPIPEADSDLENEIYKSRQVISEEEELINLGIEPEMNKKPLKKDLPWMKQVQNYLPSLFTPNDKDTNPPNATLELNYVYGFRCFDTRNNIKYSQDNELIYHQGAIAISLNTDNNQQRFFLEHTDDITCLDSQENYVATGQMGTKPAIFVWDARTMETKAVFRGVLTIGVSNLAISNDGRKLVAVGMDEDQCIVVYDVEKAIQIRINGKREDSLIASSKGPVSEVFDIKFDKSDKIIIIACMGEVNFVTFENNQIKMVKGLWDPKYGAVQAILSIGVFENAVAVGTFKGTLLQWRGSRTTSGIDAHKGPITSIYSQKGNMGIISGGKDGQICFWDYNLKCQRKITLPGNLVINQRITAICESNDRVSVGTRGGQLIEIIKDQFFIRSQGHFNGNLRALATHPTAEIFYTSGEDQMLMCWNCQENKLAQSVKLDYQCNSLDVTDKYLAGGCNNGNILIMDPITLGIHMEYKDRDSGITAIKFSPEQEYLLVFYSTPYQEFFLYSVKQKFKKISNIPGKQGNCISIDFSSTRRVQLAFSTQELFYLNLDNLTIYKNYYEEPWSTHNSIYGWPVQGIWNQHSDGTEITAADRAKTCDVLAVADNFASVKLYKFPAYKDNQSYYRYSGHSSQVSNIRFTSNDNYLISLGGSEKSIIQWKFNLESNVTDLQEQKQNNSKEDQRLKQNDDNNNNNDNNNENTVAISKPFLDLMKFEENSDQNYVPPQYLNLKYIFGIKVIHKNQNIYNILKYTASNKSVFPTAGLAVVQESKIDQSAPYRKQHYYFGHSQEIISLAMHPKGVFVATGTIGNEINIWDVDTRQTLCKINDFHKNGIYKLKFSTEGTLLLTIGLDQQHSLAIYDWQASRLVGSSKIDGNLIEDLCFLPLANQITFATCGAFLRIWTLKGRNLTFDQFQGKQCCVTYAFNSELITGNLEGELTIWKSKQYNKVNGHNGRINVLLAVKQNLYSCGNDGKIILWHFQQNALQQAQLILDQGQPIHSMDAKNENVIFVNIICELKEVITAGQVRSNDLLKCPSQEIYGLATFKNKFATCGLDRIIRIWETKNRIILYQYEFKYGLKACDWYNNLIVVGDVKCQIHLMSDKLELIHSVQTKFKQSQYEISEIKFTPDGLKIACGVTGGPSSLEVWSIINQRLEKQIIISIGFTSGLSHLDWSQDSQFIIASSEQYELKCVSVQKMRDIQFNFDIKWHTWSLQYGPCVQEIYPNKVGEDITAVSVCKDKGFLVCGDNTGLIALFHYPAQSKLSRKYNAHMAPINQLKFLLDDTYLVSIGNHQIMLWSVDQDDFQIIPEEQYNKIASIWMPQLQPKKTGLEKFGKTKQINFQEEEEQQEQEEFGQQQDQTIFTKPWMANIKEPSNYYKDQINQNTPPLIDLEIDHAFGYRGNDCRNNVKYLKNGSILFHTASLGIVMDTNLNQQKIFDLHKDDIVALDLHPDGVKVASGDLNDAIIYVWDSNTLQPLCLFNSMSIGIQSLHFSPRGDQLVALAMDPQNEIGIFDINTRSGNGGSKIYQFQSGIQKIYEIKWINNNQFYTVGPYHLKQWKLATQLQVSNIIVNQIFVTFATFDENLYIGDIDGILHIYQNQQLISQLNNHTMQIESIFVNKEVLITGSKDLLINLYDPKQLKGELIMSIKLTDYVKQAFQPQIKSVYLFEQNILVGTFGCEIWELLTKDIKINNLTKFTHKIVMKGHYALNNKSELWGLAIDGDFIYTCGDDATLRQWSISQKKQIQMIKTNIDSNYNEIKLDDNQQWPDSVKGRCIAIHSECMLVGFKDGGLRVYDRDNKQRQYLKVAKEWISDIKFSPNQDLIAIGSHDNSIYLYNYPDFSPYLKPLRKHSDFIKNIDFSIDGSKLISTCGSYDLIYWDVKTGKQIPQGRIILRDEIWHTFTNTLGWPVQGMWKDDYDGSEINCVARSYNQFALKAPDDYYLLAVGNDFNEIQIYRYPCISRTSVPICRRGHSSPVAQVKFTQDDQYLVTLGGEDMTIIIWRVIKKL